MKYAFHAYIKQAPPEMFEALALEFATDVMQPNAAAALRLKSGHVDFLRIYPDEDHHQDTADQRLHQFPVGAPL